MSDPITVDDLKTALPANLKTAASQALADKINSITTDDIIADQIKENFITYTHVLKEGKYKTEDYLNAITYVSYKHMGYQNQEAYFKTFPQRYQHLKAKGTSSKDIAAYVAAYHRGKLVNSIMEQSLIPVWLMNHENYQKAINTQVRLMETAQSEMVQTTAANSILTHLAKPKEQAALINIDMRESSGMNELQDMLTTIAKRQQEYISNGGTTKEIAEIPLIQGDMADESN